MAVPALAPPDMASEVEECSTAADLEMAVTAAPVDCEAVDEGEIVEATKVVCCELLEVMSEEDVDAVAALCPGL